MPTAKTAEERWQEHRDRLLTDLEGERDVVVLVPGWEPIDLNAGLQWLQASHYEAFKVSHLVKRDGGPAVVIFSISED
jgi:hypothetical protein